MTGKPWLAALFVAALALAGVERAAALDWEPYGDLDTIQVITSDEDGGLRLTTIWIVVVDRQAYIRTAGTTWGDNVERNGVLKLREEGGDRPLRAEKVLSAAEVERVVAAFREKYGTTDAVMEWFRFGERRVFRLVE
jgi:Uncharacterized protein conserved in bacteria (DUF2255)